MSLKVFRAPDDPKPTFVVSFAHVQEGGKVVYFRGTPEQGSFTPRAVTTCFVSTPDGEVLGEGAAFCHMQDVFNKAVGRKQALVRAIAGLSRGERALVWESYWNSGAHAF